MHSGDARGHSLLLFAQFSTAVGYHMARTESHRCYTNPCSVDPFSVSPFSGHDIRRWRAATGQITGAIKSMHKRLKGTSNYPWLSEYEQVLAVARHLIPASLAKTAHFACLPHHFTKFGIPAAFGAKLARTAACGMNLSLHLYEAHSSVTGLSRMSITIPKSAPSITPTTYRLFQKLSFGKYSPI
jgi:hypothetical protein